MKTLTAEQYEELRSLAEHNARGELATTWYSDTCDTVVRRGLVAVMGKTPSGRPGYGVTPLGRLAMRIYESIAAGSPCR